MNAYLAFFLFGGIFSLVLGYPYIRVLKYFQFGSQPIRDDGPQQHLKKVGTPTMGGLLVVFPVLCMSLIDLSLWQGMGGAVLCVFLGYAGIGLLDDLKKVLTANAYGGVTPRQKMMLQIVFAVLAVVVAHWNTPLNHQNTLFFPVINYALPLWWVYVPFAIFVVVGASNAVNLTDGLDGLVTVPVVASLSVFLLALVWLNPSVVTTLPGDQILSLSKIIILVIGACLGFLVLNLYPAKVFMGDVGSLALGGLLGILSVVLKLELVLAVTGFVFVVETLSVMIQVFWFRRTGKRFFKMAPIHHHFEHLGWSETRVVKVFWSVSLISSYVAVLLMGLGNRL